MIRIYFIGFIASIILSSCSGIMVVGGKKTEEQSDQAKVDEAFQRKFFEGQKYKALDKDDKAYLAFEECLVLDPDISAVYYEMAQLDYKNDKETSALELINQALVLDSENRWYHLLLADLNYSLGRYKEAANSYGKVIELYPKDYPVYKKRAKCFEYNNDLKSAIEVYDQLEEKTAISEELSLKKFDLYLVLGENDKAVEELERLIEVDQDEVRYYGILAEFYASQGKTDEALEMYDKMRKIAPNNGLLHWQLAQHYQVMGESEIAFDEMKLAFASPDVDVNDKNVILKEYITRGEVDKSYLTKGIKLAEIMNENDLANADSHNLLGRFLLFKGDMNEARKHFLLAIDKNSSDVISWRGILITDYALQNFEFLKEDCDAALKLYPLQAEFFLFQGFAYFKLNETNKAIISLKTGKNFVVEDPGLMAIFWQLLSKSYEQEGNSEKALSTYDLSMEEAAAETYSEKIEDDLDLIFGKTMISKESYHIAFLWYEALLTDKPNDPVLLEAIGDVYEDLGVESKAVEYWKKSSDAGNNSEELKDKIKGL